MDSSQPPLDEVLRSGSDLQPVTREPSPFAKAVARAVFPMLVCASLSLGWWVPVFYNWSGDDQSRSPPIVGRVCLGFLIACLLAVVALGWLPRLERTEPIRHEFFARLSYRSIVVLLVVMAVCGLVFRDAAFIAIGVVAVLYPLACTVRLSLVSPSLRWRIVSLYSCLYLPFAWVFSSEVTRNLANQGAWMLVPLLAAAPALLGSVLIAPLVGLHGPLVWSSGVTMVAVEVVVGLWVIQLGARRAAAYQIGLLALSTITSYGLYALMRA